MHKTRMKKINNNFLSNFKNKKWDFRFTRSKFMKALTKKVELFKIKMMLSIYKILLTVAIRNKLLSKE
jgi:hypothetical protein